MSTTTGADGAPPETHAWTMQSREGVSVHAPRGSPAEQAIAGELDVALRAREELVELLDPPPDRRFEPIDVFLVELPAEDSAVGADDVALPPIPPGAVVRYVDPAMMCEPLPWPLTRSLVGRWYGERVASSGAVVDGIAGVVAGRVGSGPSVSDADGVTLELLQTGPPPSLVVGAEASAEASPVAALTERHLLATSFVAFLLETHGTDALRSFLARWDAERRDDAALEVYSEPLAALEESWLRSLAPGSSVQASLRRLGRQLLPLLRANWWRELELTGYTLLDAGFSIGIPLLTALFINELTAGNEGAIVPYMLLLAGFFFLLTPITLRREYAGTVLSQQMLFQLQHEVFRRLLYLPHSFHSRANLGDLMVRLTADVERVREATEAVLRQAVYVLIKGVAAAIVLFFIDPVLAALTIATVPLFWIGHLAFNSRLEEASMHAQTSFGELGTATHESLSAHAAIKAFGLEERTLSEYRARTRRFFDSVRRVVILGSTLDATSSMAVTVSQLVVLGVGGYMVSQGNLEIGFLLMFLQTLPIFFEAIGTLTGVRRTVTQASGAMDRVLEVLEEPLLIEDKPNPTAR